MSEEQPKKGFKDKILHFYDKRYRQILIIPNLLLLIIFAIIIGNYFLTGEVIQRDTSLKGGITITLFGFTELKEETIKKYITDEFPHSDVEAISLVEGGRQKGFVIESSDLSVEQAIAAIEKNTGKISKDSYVAETIGPSLGASFFRETLKAVLIAFFFMGTVVFLYFGTDLTPKIIATGLTIIFALVVFFSKNIFTYITAALLAAALIYVYIKYSIPSAAVMLSAFADIAGTLAIAILLGVKLSVAGVAAYLMLIGYSVDTDILLTSRVLKRKGGTIFEATIGAMKTGLTMTITAIVAVSVAYIFTSSTVMKEIMLILFIGLWFDMFNTWLQNAGILRWYLEKKEKQHHNHEHNK